MSNPSEPRENKRAMTRRSPWHDYRRRGTYMLTLVVAERVPLLGALAGDVAAPYVAASPLGRVIVQEEIPKIHGRYPQVEVWQVCLMPDHLHLIVSVREDLPQDKHLGRVVAGFKLGCNRAYWRCYGMDAPPRRGLFEAGYNDKILLNDGQLDRWKAYLADNPRRLMLKRQHPQLFTVLYDMTVAGHRCQMVGNRFLLDIPDKMAVIVHRRYTAAEYARRCEQWLACGERGGVLVSAAISPREKAVLREARRRGYPIILLRENGFPRLYKPSGEAFDACAQGLLLQISPWDYHTRQQTITRAQCLALNALAEEIASDGEASDGVACNGG